MRPRRRPQRPDRLAVGVRAFARPAAARAPRTQHKRTEEPRWPSAVLVIDTETTTDATQRLLFGSYRYCRWRGRGQLDCVAEGLIYADDLQRRDHAAYRRLLRYCRTRHADVDPEANRELRFLSRTEFVDRVLWPAAYKGRALVVGFNLPFDLTRLTTLVGLARGWYRGGFSLRLWPWQRQGRAKDRENPYRPRLCIKHVDSKRAFMGFARPGKRDAKDGRPHRGRFLDLRTLAFALTDLSHNLRSACEAFGVQHGKLTATKHGSITAAYIDYSRRDVEASAELLVKLREEFDRHPVELDPCKAFSPASIGKAYLKAIRIASPAERFSNVTPEVLGYAMTAYYGGRAEVRIRRTPVPVVYLDFLSMYPTVNALMGLWRLLTSSALKVVDSTDEVGRLLANVSLDACFDPAQWPAFAFFAEIVPEDDIVPVRARYTDGADSLTIGVNHLTSSEPFWYAGPDLVASTLLTGKAPHVLRAFRLVPRGKQPTLRAVKLRGAIPIDPSTEDFFLRVIETRQRLKRGPAGATPERERLDLFLKVLANSTSYGIFAELNRVELPSKKEGRKVTIFGSRPPFEVTTCAPEELGPFFFPPVAALIPSAARLMLALLERCVTDLGGHYAFCDTDSMAVVASQGGGPVACDGGVPQAPDGASAIRALRWVDVRQIVGRFAALNPYDREAVPGSILKVEDVNHADGRQRQLHAFAISAKRYVLYSLSAKGEPSIVDCKEHGLGHLLNPIDPDEDDRNWIRECWDLLLRKALGLPAEPPSWLGQPALGRLAASSPALWKPMTREGQAYADSIKPMNFLISAQVTRLGHPAGVNPKRFHLIALFSSDPRLWPRARWTDIYSGRQFRTTTRGSGSGDVVRVVSYREVLDAYAVHPEPKSADAAGTPCGLNTVGLLARRHVTPTSIAHIGKESNRLEDVEGGCVHDARDVVIVYG